jgi:hypothetical protein
MHCRTYTVSDVSPCDFFLEKTGELGGSRLGRCWHLDAECALAFAMSQHRRLGMRSEAHGLVGDLVLRMIHILFFTYSRSLLAYSRSHLLQAHVLGLFCCAAGAARAASRAFVA